MAELYNAEKNKGVQVNNLAGQVVINAQTFDFKKVLMQLLPTLMGLVTELLVTGKLAKVKGRDIGLIKSVLYAIIGELERLEGNVV